MRSAVALGKPLHAYLFTGPPGVGKRTLAGWLAQSLLCERRQPGESEPCGVCGACTRIAHGTHPDVQVFGLARQAQASDRAAASRELGIDTVRELVAEMPLLPFQADRKVYIIEDADTLTEEAANSLLKTLEEPPAYATLVLLVADERALPETVRSRCTPVRLHAVAELEIREYLEGLPDVSTRAAQKIAHLATGRPSWAIQAARDPSLLEAHYKNVEALVTALDGGAVGRLGLAEVLSKRWSAGHRQEVYATLFDWIGYWRDVMYVAAHPDSTPAEALEGEIQKRAQGGVEAAARAAGRTLQAIAHLDANVSTRMAIETLLLDLP